MLDDPTPDDLASLRTQIAVVQAAIGALVATTAALEADTSRPRAENEWLARDLRESRGAAQVVS